ANLPHGDSLFRSFKSRAVAARLVVPEREGEPERSGLGVYAVRASGLRRLFELVCAALQDFEERVRLVEQKRAGVAQEQCVRRVNHVGRGEAVVYEARGFADTFGERGGEGDHVVVGRLLYLAYALDRERGTRLY